MVSDTASVFFKLKGEYDEKSIKVLDGTMKKIIEKSLIALPLLLTLLWTGISLADSYSGLWWDPSKAGQGISVIQHNDTICGAWYLYDESGRDTWLVFTGVLKPSGSVKTKLFQYTGPPLGSKWDTGKLKASYRGTITLTFNSPGTATMQYSVDGKNGTLNLLPFANDVAVMFWDSGRPGQGVSFFMEGLKAYVIWYLYDKKGRAMWVTSGTDLGLQSTSGNLYRFTGPALGSQWDSSLVVSSTVGKGSIVLSNSKEIPFSYNIDGVSGLLDLVPFVCDTSN